ncbi:MAG: lytic transglycosylase domain-containing protein [Candidatus Latescibacteria bacterium]|nr:lytic transglycosylase domain-containing protein [Candidatus Latescibacterota bacterium]
MNEEGERQLLYTIRGRPLRKDRLYSIWELCVEGRAYGAAVSIGERLLNGSLWDGDDPRFREIKYPLYYADLIVSETSGWDLDPFLVLALIKQESAFEQDARSYVGARGLMQLMPATADEWARRLRHPPVEDEDLYNPRINLRLGIPYLARLVNQFNGSIEKALAAYNAGPTNVRRWERGLPDERPETFIESIGFSETRTFVRTILNHYYRYRYLWSQRVGG